MSAAVRVGEGKILVRDVLRVANEMAGCDLRNRDNRRWPASIRQAAYKVARDLTGRSYSLIGGVFERDHSTVILGIRVANPAVVASVWRETMKGIPNA